MNIFHYLILLIFHTCAFKYARAESFNCSVQNNLPVSQEETVILLGGLLEVKYDREELEVYKYEKTKSVNILLNDVEIRFKGNLFTKSDESNSNVISTFRTILEGIAVVTKNRTLNRCNFQLKSDFQNNKQLSVLLQDKIFFLTKNCIESTICPQIGEITLDDYVRAKIGRHEFGDYAVLYNQIGDYYPNIDLPSKHQYNDISQTNSTALQTTLNIIFDFILVGLISRISTRELGKIDIPNMKEVIPGKAFIDDGYVKLTNGTFSDFKNVYRNQDIQITNDGLQFALGFGVELPNAIIHFDEYNVKYMFIHTHKPFNITIDNITFSIKVVINFNHHPCSISVSYLHCQIEGIKFTLPEGSFWNKLISKAVTSIINKFEEDIVGYVKLKIKEAISAPLEHFDCERYRPFNLRKNHKQSQRSFR